jgi:hypothetical protein
MRHLAIIIILFTCLACDSSTGPQPSPPDIYYGYLWVRCNRADMTILLDREPIGLTLADWEPVRIQLPAPGHHFVELQYPYPNTDRIGYTEFEADSVDGYNFSVRIGVPW